MSINKETLTIKMDTADKISYKTQKLASDFYRSNTISLKESLPYKFPPHKLITYLLDVFKLIVTPLRIGYCYSNFVDFRVLRYCSDDNDNERSIGRGNLKSPWYTTESLMEAPLVHPYFTIHIGSDLRDEHWWPYIAHVDQTGIVIHKHYLGYPIKQNDYSYREHYKIMTSRLGEFLDYLEKSTPISCKQTFNLLRGWVSHGEHGQDITNVIDYITNRYPVYYFESFKGHNNLNFFIHAGEPRKLIHLEIDENKLNNQLVIKIVKGEYTPSEEEDTFKFTNFIPTPLDGKMEMKLLSFRSEKEEKLLDTMVRYFMKTESK